MMNDARIVVIEVDDQKISGVITVPDQVKPANTGVLLLHPHPLYGGTMDDFIINSVERDLLRFGFITMRFNFRPVDFGTTYSGVAGAVADGLAAWDVFVENSNVSNLGLIGYSFGGSVALHLASLRQPSFLVTLSAAYSLASEIDNIVERLGAISCPTLLIHGFNDRVIPMSDYQEIVRHLDSSIVQTIVLDGEGHFYNNNLRTAKDAILSFVKSIGH